MPSAPDNLPELREWLARVLHDLVKYLEMMPRSLDWEHLEDDDVDVLHEAVFQTRSSREGSRSAREIWEARLAEAPALGDEGRATVGRVSAALAELEILVGELDDSLDGVDTAHIRRVLFSVGDELRAYRDRVGQL